MGVPAVRRWTALILSLFLFTGTQAGAAQRHTMYFFDTFDTMITIIGYTDNQQVFERITEEAKIKFQKLHLLFDAYSEYEGVANICTLNRLAALHPVRVEAELMDLLRFAKQWQPKVQNSVNIAMGSILQLWHHFRTVSTHNKADAAIPSMEALLEAAQHTSFDDVVLDEEAGTVFFADPKLQLDVGAVAKGYAAGVVMQWLLASDMPNFILNAGGNVCVGEKPLDGRVNWGVSIQNPDTALLVGSENDSLDVLFVQNTCVVTSGDYQRFFEVDGVRYHHIISPYTLLPASEHRAVTIVCANSALADLLSTAVFILPYEEGLALVEGLEGVEALWVDHNLHIRMTEGMKRLSQRNGATAR